MPVILKLIPRRRRTWVELRADDGSSIRLPREIVLAGLAAGDAIDEGEWARLTADADYHGLLDRALRLLSRCEHFTAELRRKLRQRSTDVELIDRVLAECRRLGYLDDERAVDIILGHLLERGGIGKARLRQVLIERGCPPALAAAAVSEHAGELDESAEVKKLLAMRRQRTTSQAHRLREKLGAKLDDPRRVRSELRRRLGATLTDYLARRGFTREHTGRPVQQLVDELMDELASAQDVD